MLGLIVRRRWSIYTLHAVLHTLFGSEDVYDNKVVSLVPGGPGSPA